MKKIALILAVAGLMIVSGCADQQEENKEVIPDKPAEVTDKLVVFAAASLDNAFTEIAEVFESDNPGVKVTLNFGPSSTLAEQIRSGAPSDVLATADEESIASLGNQTGEAQLFATNFLSIAMPAGNPGKITDLADFANPKKKIAICADEVPCGYAARQMFFRSGITPSIDTFGKDATATINLVSSGEVDAALVYDTDILDAGDKVESIAIPAVQNYQAGYYISLLSDAMSPSNAQAFIDLVYSARGVKILEKHGFIVDR